MKKRHFLLYMFLYSILFIFTLLAQWINIRETKYKIAINMCTVVLGLFSVILFHVLYKTEPSYFEKGQTVTKIPDKEIYMKFAEKNRLSKREREIGWLLLNGESNQQLAETLFISITTVKKHLTHIYEKTGVSCRKEFKEVIGKYQKETDCLKNSL
jgi:DNA-binding CsgD family transcriptional regulator